MPPTTEVNHCNPSSFFLFICFNQLVGGSTLDPLYFNVVLFDINTYRCVEDKDYKDNIAAARTSKLKCL